MPLQEGVSPNKEKFDVEIRLLTNMETGELELTVEYYSVDPVLHEHIHKTVVEKVKRQLGLEDIKVNWVRTSPQAAPVRSVRQPRLVSTRDREKAKTGSGQ